MNTTNAMTCQKPPTEQGAECLNCGSWSDRWTAGAMCPHCANPAEVAARTVNKTLVPLGWKPIGWR